MPNPFAFGNRLQITYVKAGESEPATYIGTVETEPWLARNGIECLRLAVETKDGEPYGGAIRTFRFDERMLAYETA